MPDEDPFCTSLPSELYWGMHSNSSLHGCRLCQVGSRTSGSFSVHCTAQNKMERVGLTAENGVLAENDLQCICHKIFTKQLLRGWAQRSPVKAEIK